MLGFYFRHVCILELRFSRRCSQEDATVHIYALRTKCVSGPTYTVLLHLNSAFEPSRPSVILVLYQDPQITALSKNNLELPEITLQDSTVAKSEI
jgi:hypothetical protein